MRTEIRKVDPRELKLLDVNARYFTHEQFKTLVDNIRRDGSLSSVPFVWARPDGALEVLSGNHRTKAAIEAGLEEIEVMVTDEPLTPAQRTAIVLSHNAVGGQDDPATLKLLYDSIEDVDWRQYAGLDDKTLELLEQVEVESLAEVNLDFASVQIMFLPGELDEAKAAFDEARRLVTADERWLALVDQQDELLDAIALVKDAYLVGNIATALGVILRVFDAHLDELRDGWLDGRDYTPKHKGLVPFESMFGTRLIPAEAAAVVAQALDRMVGREEVPHQQKWLAMERWAADYLAGP